MIENTITYKKRKLKQQWFEETDFSKLSNVTQAHGFLFNDKGKILIISLDNGKTWTLPGGTPELKDKSYMDTLTREVEEEADVEITNIFPIGYINSIFLDKPKSDHQQLRYIAKVSKVKKQTEDPAYNKKLLRKLIRPEDFLTYCLWGKIGRAMLTSAIKTRHSN